ncbi:RcnB family protein [Stenotrophomonas sp. Marseille-Q4652]|uniref:RcnB family protein n=1 Tax=Stenotrophomonas sp. Marseille-Q4652 TaxID=2866595 RepID=UPI001CE3F0EC|nr:RcnB family protein [Stenotrophomonas sp. Marseille-Q4652]
MKHITATVLSLALLASGSAMAAPAHKGPQHGPKPPVMQPKHVTAPRHVAAPPSVRHAPPSVVRHAPARPVVVAPRRGDRLPPHVSAVRINDWRYAGLRQPPRGYEWRRVDNQSLLVAIASGVIADIVLHR